MYIEDIDSRANAADWIENTSVLHSTSVAAKAISHDRIVISLNIHIICYILHFWLFKTFL